MQSFFDLLENEKYQKRNFFICFMEFHDKKISKCLKTNIEFKTEHTSTSDILAAIQMITNLWNSYFFNFEYRPISKYPYRQRNNDVLVQEPDLQI